MLQVIRIILVAALAAALMMASMCALGCKKNQGNASRVIAPSLEQRVRSLVSVGMSEQETVQALGQAGIKHSAPVQPVKGGNYFQIHVPIVDDISAAAAGEYTVTGTNRVTGQKAYVVITLDENRVVTSIE